MSGRARRRRRARRETSVMPLPMETIRGLVGEISEIPFAYVDFAVTRDLGLFVPVGGQCDYAVTPSHTHPTYSFVVSFDDFCQVAVDGGILRSRPGTFSAFAPGVPHQELPTETPARYVAVMVRQGYFDEQFAIYERALPALRGQAFESTPRLVAGLREFMSEYEEQGPGYEALLAATAQKITHLLIRQMLSTPKQDEKVDFRMAANDAVEFMHTHLHEKITLGDLARVGRLSLSQFARVFKEELGTTPIEYLQELRLLRAKRLLRDTDQPITQVALDCGYGSSSYFSRCFQERFKVSPSGFRKALGRS
jgi:AraC family transcriptional regulator